MRSQRCIGRAEGDFVSLLEKMFVEYKFCLASEMSQLFSTPVTFVFSFFLLEDGSFVFIAARTESVELSGTTRPGLPSRQ